MPRTGLLVWRRPYWETIGSTQMNELFPESPGKALPQKSHFFCILFFFSKDTYYLLIVQYKCPTACLWWCHLTWRGVVLISGELDSCANQRHYFLDLWTRQAEIRTWRRKGQGTGNFPRAWNQHPQKQQQQRNSQASQPRDKGRKQ